MPLAIRKSKALFVSRFGQQISPETMEGILGGAEESEFPNIIFTIQSPDPLDDVNTVLVCEDSFAAMKEVLLGVAASGASFLSISAIAEEGAPLKI